MTDLSDSVHVSVDDEHPARYAEPATEIRTGDLDKADWHLRKLAELRAEQAQIAGVFNREIARIEERRDDELRKLGNAIDWHERPLRQLHAAILAADEDRKTIVLPHGTLKSRTPRTPKLRVVDKDAFETWAHERAPHLLKPKFSPDSDMLKAELATGVLAAPTPKNGEALPVAVKATGEQVPGLVLELDEPTFTVDQGDWT